ncbi:MAG: hypothetical protein ACFCD0_02680 [Gemmataceae bacterium]
MPLPVSRPNHNRTKITRPSKTAYRPRVEILEDRINPADFALGLNFDVPKVNDLIEDVATDAVGNIYMMCLN